MPSNLSVCTTPEQRLGIVRDIAVMPPLDAKIIGKGLLQQPVKRVNDVTKLLQLVADSDEVQYFLLFV